MSRVEPGLNITLSVLDRLIDPEPATPADPPMTRAQSFREMKAAVKRDLEWLLNSRQTPQPAGDELPLARKSVYNYGLPDLTTITIQSSADRGRMLRLIEETVSRYEPRIQDVKVEVDAVSASSRTLRFRIEGLLRVDPAPERVSFDTVLELTSGEYEVK